MLSTIYGGIFMEIILFCVGFLLIFLSGVWKNEKDESVPINKPLLYTGGVLVLLAGLGIPFFIYTMIHKKSS